MNKLVLFILCLSVLGLVVGEEKNAQKQHPRKKFAANKKQYNLKCWPQRCSIICPIFVQPMPQIQNTGPPVPSESLPPSNTLVSTTHSPASVSTTPTSSKTNTSHQLIPQLINNLTNLRHDVNGKIMNLLEYNKHLIPNLKSKRKDVVVKQFIQNKNSKKAIKFRQQFAPLGCYVQCESLQMGQPNPAAGVPDQVIRPGTGGQTNTDAPNIADGEDDGEEEDETDEPYHEGEDRPIEMTASPPDRSKILVYNFDDEPYYGSGIYLEDKHKKNRSKGKSKHRHLK